MVKKETKNMSEVLYRVLEGEGTKWPKTCES